MISFIPELVAPGGSLEKLQLAYWYGADSVYVAGESYGLRTAADNFSFDQLKMACRFAHDQRKKIYVVINAFLHDKNFEGLSDFLDNLVELKVDAVIVSDLGVISFIKKRTNLAIHLSTQHSCLNAYAASLCKEIGVRRIVLGREVSISEAHDIREKSQLEMEMFIHGSMCMSYSGQCLISNYTAKRDANRGGCQQSCRFFYQFNDQSDSLYSSKDLRGYEFLDLMVNARIDALKIEGRMKTPHYLATVVKAYRTGLDRLKNYKPVDSAQLDELEKIKSRDYCSGNLVHRASTESVYHQKKEEKSFEVAGIVYEIIADQSILVSVRCPFRLGDELEFMPFTGENKKIIIKEMCDIENGSLQNAKSGTVIKLPFLKDIERGNVVRVKRW